MGLRSAAREEVHPGHDDEGGHQSAWRYAAVEMMEENDTTPLRHDGVTAAAVRRVLGADDPQPALSEPS
jgi:hypothetical protein